MLWIMGFVEHTTVKNVMAKKSKPSVKADAKASEEETIPSIKTWIYHYLKVG